MTLLDRCNSVDVCSNVYPFIAYAKSPTKGPYEKKQYILTLLLILSSYGHIKGNELDYSTTQIRKMWFECSTGLRVNYPKIPAQIKIVLCDCYVNQVRRKYAAKEVLELTKEESGKLGLEVAQICSKIPEEHKNKTKAIPVST